jgi:hypothetical protein
MEKNNMQINVDIDAVAIVIFVQTFVYPKIRQWQDDHRRNTRREINCRRK